MSAELENSNQLMLFAAASPVRIYLWPASARAWLESDQGYGSSFYALLDSIARDGLSSRMCPAFLAPTSIETLPQSFEGWSNAGIASRGGCLMLNFTEWPSAAVVCSLSEVLETEVAPKYFLSPKACRGILRRAEKRGRELPTQLRQALERVAALETEMEIPYIFSLTNAQSTEKAIAAALAAEPDLLAIAKMREQGEDV